jgi:hypothetical protein
MGFMLVLLGIVLVAVICTAREIVKGWRRGPEGFPLLQSNRTDACRRSITKKREIRSISVKECETLFHASGDVIFIVVQRSGERRSLPFPEKHALAVTPAHLASELRWIPRSSCVVLCGDMNLCSSTLASLEDIPGAPPIYVLKDGPSRREVA